MEDTSSLGRSGAGGGGGYFGGASGGWKPAAGGSSYISGLPGVRSVADDSAGTVVLKDSIYHYSSKYFFDAEMIDGEGYK